VRRRPRLGGLLNFYERAALVVGSAEHWNITRIKDNGVLMV
jgi:hypothetical protein